MIRAYNKRDDQAIVNVWLAASTLAHPFLSSQIVEQEKKNLQEIYLPNTVTWVYELEGKLVGFISMIDNEVGAIFLLPRLHGRGIGSTLMDWVAQRHDVLEVEVFEANNIGRTFYDRYGFRYLKKYVHQPTNEPVLRLKYDKA